MERSIALLHLNSAGEPIPDWDSEQPTVDPYQSMQIHDYLQVSFFRTPGEVKNASKKTVELFQKYYPELLEKKFFVNVPFLMGWVYNAMKLLVARETFKKLIMLSYGQELAKHMGSDTIPTIYGGKGESLDNASTSCVDAGAGAEGDVLGTVPNNPGRAGEVGPGEQPPVPAGGEVVTVEDTAPTTVTAPADRVVSAPTDATPTIAMPEAK